MQQGGKYKSDHHLNISLEEIPKKRKELRIWTSYISYSIHITHCLTWGNTKPTGHPWEPVPASGAATDWFWSRIGSALPQVLVWQSLPSAPHQWWPLGIPGLPLCLPMAGNLVWTFWDFDWLRTKKMTELYTSFVRSSRHSVITHNLVSN